MEIEQESKTFIKLTPVIDINFLDKELVIDCIKQCYLSETGVDQEYVKWNTNWKFSSSSKDLSNHLLLKGIPQDKEIILQMV